MTSIGHWIHFRSIPPILTGISRLLLCNWWTNKEILKTWFEIMNNFHPNTTSWNLEVHGMQHLSQNTFFVTPIFWRWSGSNDDPFPLKNPDCCPAKQKWNAHNFDCHHNLKQPFAISMHHTTSLFLWLFHLSHWWLINVGEFPEWFDTAPSVIPFSKGFPCWKLLMSFCKSQQYLAWWFFFLFCL